MIDAKDAAAGVRRSNPFSTRFVRPGATAYLFEPGASAAELVARLAAAGWRGQIIGPHGSGKSTLLAALAEPLAQAGRRLWTVALRDGSRRMPAGWTREAASSGARLIVIDGYEQLSFVSRLAVRVHCLRRGWGLLVAAHRDVGLPTLMTTASSLENAQAIARQLQSGSDPRVGPEVVAECFAAAGGDVRETLFRLYDRWESVCSRSL
jgi:energy-coupling factor transporter ATP-binding protein EcfA2